MQSPRSQASAFFPMIPAVCVYPTSQSQQARTAVPAEVHRGLFTAWHIHAVVQC